MIQFAQDLQSARKDLSNTLLRAWKNVFVGNQVNLQNWSTAFRRDLKQARKTSVAYDRDRSLISSVTVSLALLIIAAGNAVFLLQHRDDVTLLAGLIITFPRQLQIIQNIFAFFNIYLSWSGVWAQLKQLERILNVGQTETNAARFVNLREIQVSDGRRLLEYATVTDILRDIGNLETGRLTLRGANGSGKSTLLSLFAERTGDWSFYLPSEYSGLAFNSLVTVNGSDGQRLLAVFEEIEKLKEVKFILLDEWDANLDGENLRIIHEQIDVLARNKVVVECRHRY